MKILNIYEVERYGKSQLLWEREDGTWKITDTGQNRLSHMTIEKITVKEAKKLINENQNMKTLNPFTNECIMCLEKLVHLKEHKDSVGKSDYYNEEQPKTWQWAKNLIKAAEWLNKK